MKADDELFWFTAKMCGVGVAFCFLVVMTCFVAPAVVLLLFCKWIGVEP